MRMSAIVAAFSAIGTAVSGISYFLISTPGHYMKAAAIRSNPNGDIFWLQDWEFNRIASLACAAFSLVVFVWSYSVLWLAQSDDLKHNRS